MIDSYSFGCMIVDGREYRSDLIILPDSIVTDWRRESGHLLRFVDIEKYMEKLPNVLVVGTGRLGMMRIAEPLRGALHALHKSLVAERTDMAWKTFNRFLREGKPVGGAFHLTC